MGRKKLDLRGSVVAITGGSGGLGRATAQELARRGARVAILDLDQAASEAAAREIGGVEIARGWAVDVRSLAALETAMADVDHHFGQIDVVVAGAGIGNLIAPLRESDPASFERVIDINLVGVWRTFKAAEPYVAKRRGHLLAVASMASFLHSPLHGSYTASKAGVWAMCNSLRLELRESNVTVGTLHPAFFATPMTDGIAGDPVASKVWDNFEGVFSLIPIEDVVTSLVDGIERRQQQIVCPKKLTLARLAPGLIRPMIERSYPRANVAAAIAAYRKASV